jgi:2-amino-4-hydroxy-6-hydroxymethyldihydropteridine diphosphokinase
MKSDAIYIALGGNLPSAGRTPRETLAAALETLSAAGVQVRARSSDWSSPAWPDPSEPAYVNAVAQVATELPPRELLDLLHRVEAEFGRQRSVRNAPRPLDLDLIDYAGRVESASGGPELPHPRACGRAFVLLPLAEIAPDWTDPVSGCSISQLVAALPKADRDATCKLQPAGPGASPSLAFAGREG